MRHGALGRIARRLLGRRPSIAVSEARGVRTLHVGGEAVQSAMRLDDPFALALDYTRCMMAFLLFHPEPREILMIGLGGGSLAKYAHQRLRGARIRAVELDERIVALARSLFHLPADDARLRVEVGDGAEALAPECADVLLVDGFEDESVPGTLASQAFFDAAWAALTEPGVLVMNLMSDDPGLDRVLQRMEAAFGGAVLCAPALSDPNVIAFALKGAPARLPWQVLRARAERLQARHGLPFGRYVNALRRMNGCDGTHLYVVPAAAA